MNNEDMTEKHFLLNQQALMSAGKKELRDFSMEETWNLITATADSRKSFGRTWAMLALLKGREKGLRTPTELPGAGQEERSDFSSHHVLEMVVAAMRQV